MIRIHVNTTAAYCTTSEPNDEEVVDIIPLQSLTARTLLMSATHLLPYSIISSISEMHFIVILFTFTILQQFSIAKLPWPYKVNI